LDKWTPRDDQLLNLIVWWREGDDRRRKELEAEIVQLHQDGLLGTGSLGPLMLLAIESKDLKNFLVQYPLVK
jgi:hypothetical protein